jgi:hypothetical protein
MADLQNYHDPDRKLPRVMSEFGDPRWELGFVDDGVSGKRDKIGGRSRTRGRSQAAGDAGPAAARRKKLHGMPESAMCGWCGEKARELETPLGYAYPAIVTALAAMINGTTRGIRPTMYTVLIGPVHCGKMPDSLVRAFGIRGLVGVRG